MAGYALSLSTEELARYRRMAQLARAQEADWWARAGILPAARVVDLGCGPGATTSAMAEVVGDAGAVTGIDGDPSAVAAARALLAAEGRCNAQVQAGDVRATALPAGSFDVAVLRHVLAHNQREEKQIVEHAASLVRPGGCVYLVDIDHTMFRRRDTPPVLEEMWARYSEFHTARGNDLQVGLRLATLLRTAGLTIVLDELVGIAVDFDARSPGPAWAAREAMLAAGVVSGADLSRWATELAATTHEAPGRSYVPVFVAVGRT